MNREELVLERLRAADPAPTDVRIDPDALVTIFSLLEERRDTVTTHTPTQTPQPTKTPRRWPRSALAFGVALVALVIAIGAGIVLFGGGDEEEVVTSSTTTIPTEATTPAPTTSNPEAEEPTTTVLPGSPPPQLSWARVDLEGVIDPESISTIVSGPEGFLLGSEETLLTSPDGASWSTADGAPLGTTEYLTFGNGHYLALAASKDPVGNLLDSVSWTSVDGAAWERGEVLGHDAWNLTAGEPGFVVVGVDDEPPIAAISFSSDGVTWVQIANEEGILSGASESSWTIARDVAYGPAGYVVIGEDDFTSADVKGAVWISPNGLDWQRIDHQDAAFGIPDTETWFSMFAVTHGDSGYVAVGVIDGPARHSAAFWRSVDGNRWELYEVDLPGGGGVEDVIALQHGYLAAGEILVATEEGSRSQAALWYSPDGATWTRLPTDEAFSPDGRQSMLAQIAADGRSVVAYGFLERPVADPPAADPQATHEWVDTIWYSPLG